MNTRTDSGQLPAEAEAEAQFAAGVRLLACPENAGDFARGSALVEDSAARGHSGAAAMLATLEAIGAGRRQDWNRAFDHLVAAAELGSEQARAQLRLLGGAATDEWRALRGKIDVDRLLAVPERRALSETPRMRILPGFATAAECGWVIEKLRPRLAPAMVWDDRTGLGRVDPDRSGSAVELRLPEMDVVIEALRARISAATGLPEAIF